MFEAMIHLENSKKEPLYIQIYQFYKKEIQEGRIPSGMKLPSKRKLAAHLGIGLNTVDAAYQQLLAEGYAESRQRKGYYTAELDYLFPVNNEEAGKSESERKRQPEPHMIDFNHGRVDIEAFPHSVWKKCLMEAMNQTDWFVSGNPQGEHGLREEIASYLYQSRGVRCRPEQIVIGAGTQYLMHLLVLLLGKKVYALEEPGFHRVREVLKQEQAEIAFIPLDDSGIRVDLLQENQAGVAYVTPSHQFPEGMVMPIARRTELLKWATNTSGYIIEDDYDGEFRYTGRPIPSLQGLDTNGRVIYMGTFSKSLIPAIRVGYMVLPSELALLFRKTFRGYKQTVSKTDQEALCLFMKGGHWERHLNKMRTIYRKKNKVLLRAIDESFSGRVQVIGEKSGLHVLLDVRNGMAEAELIQSAARKGVKVYPTSVYHSGSSAGQAILIGYGGLTQSEIEEGTRKLGKAWF